MIWFLRLKAWFVGDQLKSVSSELPSGLVATFWISTAKKVVMWIKLTRAETYETIIFGDSYPGFSFYPRTNFWSRLSAFVRSDESPKDFGGLWLDEKNECFWYSCDGERFPVFFKDIEFINRMMRKMEAGERV